MAAAAERTDEHVEKQVLRRIELTLRLATSPSALVWRVIEKRTRRVVALKKCFDVFSTPEQAQATYREVMYLTEFSRHDNIASLQHLIKSESDEDLYITFDYMESDLHRVIAAKVLDPVHMKYIVYQLLKALKYIHSCGVVHRDVKPSNILLNGDCHLKLCDFGSCRSLELGIKDLETPKLTDYVATRWYRAIEILLGSTQYTQAVDVWAVGCVFAEMLLNRPLFAGHSPLDQIVKILEVIGRPPPDDLPSVKSAYAATLLEMMPPLRPVSLIETLAGTGSEPLNLINQCLAFNPASRCTIGDAIRHPYVAEFHDPHDEPVRKSKLILPLDDFYLYSAAEYREAIYASIRERKTKQRTLSKKKMINPKKTILIDHDEALPEDF